VRADALRTGSPADVLGRLHDALKRSHHDQFCTALYLTIERNQSGGGVRLRLASGGHHLPLRFGPDGRSDSIGATGMLLGILDSPSLVDTTAELSAGDVVVLFTDGVPEGRRGDEFFGDDRIVSVVREAVVRGEGAQEIADGLVQATLDFEGGLARDDIAVVVLRVLP
jgi:sigma-B regulation protein RsbU (phosphoserine phosphatase)